jgi:hypothetical protein
VITQGNDKLGPLVWGWSLPAVKTCPGASAACIELCYGLAGRFHMPNVKEAHKKNFKLSKTPHFASWMTGMIRDFCVTTLRIHVVGDFYSEEYIAKWRQVVRSNRQVKFFTYTRSWNVPDLAAPLLELGQEKNLRMWLSFDATMPVPPKPKGLRRCYLSQNDEDLPPQGKADLIFRDNQDTKLKRAPDGTLVCPPENGATRLTCSKCKLCWLKKTGPAKRKPAEIA